MIFKFDLKKKKKLKNLIFIIYKYIYIYLLKYYHLLLLNMIIWINKYILLRV
jgi:hypothetical protein